MKLWTFASSALAVLFLLAAIFFQVRGTAQAEHFRQAENTATQARSEAEEKADAAEKLKAQADRKLIELDRELAASKARETTVGAQLRQAHLETRQLKNTVSNLEADHQALEIKLKQIQRDLIEAKSQPSIGQNQEHKQLEHEITALKSRLIALQRHPPPQKSFTIPIEILSISARADVVALNRGAANGLNQQHVATLKRGDTPVAQLRLHDVQPSFSIAHVVEHSPGQTLAKGSSYTLLIKP